MGANEDELKKIAAAGHFKIAELSRLQGALSVLQDTLKTVAGASGWTGASQKAAADHMVVMSSTYAEVEQLAATVESVITEANKTVGRAVDALNALPDSKVPSWVHGALDTAEKTIPFPGLGPVLVGDGAVSVIEGFLGNKREEAAGKALTTYQAELADHATSLSMARAQIESVPPRGVHDIPHGPTSTETPVGGVGPVGPTFSGNYAQQPQGGHGGPPTFHVDPTDDPGPNVDDGSTGYLPPTGTPTGTGVGGGGGVSPVVGSVLGGGVGMAGALTSARMGGGLGGSMPGVGAAPRLGSGGLLGAGGPAVTGKGAAGGAGVAGGAGASGGGTAGGRGAGSRGGLSGAGTGARGDKETKRRAGVGLGGPIAPKLEDDELLAPRAAGTRAGGRDESVDFADVEDGGE